MFGFKMNVLCCSCLFLAAMWKISLAETDNIIRFHSADRMAILNMHNDLRRSIYNAANMRELTWNHAVAHAAAEWGTKCNYVSRPDNMWGQNMNYFHDTEARRTPLELFRDSFKGWANETMHYDYRRFKHCGKKNVCSYVQLIAANVEQVGCAVVKCPNLQLHAPEGIQEDSKVLLCFYTPWIDIMGSEVFIPHTRCSACPPGTTCSNKLCSARFSPDTDTRPLLSSSSLSSATVEVRGQESDVKVVSQSARQRGQGRRRGRGRGRGRGRERARTQGGERRGSQSTNTVITSLPEGTAVKGEQRENIVYVPNNRVVPFPGNTEKDEIRQLRRDERYLALHQHKGHVNKTDSVVAVEAVKETVPTTQTNSSSGRVKRQADHNDPRYLRRLEEQRRQRDHWRRENERQNEFRRRQEAERTRRQREQARRRQRDDEHRRKQEEERQRRVQSLRRLQNEGELSSSEQYYTISAHNLLRKESASRELTWSSHLERWAKYVIRCDIEYPGPITCYTNFGKAERGKDIYNVVYEWGAEGTDVTKPIRYGCRTPYDRSRCNHYTIIRDPKLTQMGCAAKDCGAQRQLTCIYNSG